MKVVVCGGREFKDRSFIFAELDRVNASHHFQKVIEGAARGVDQIAGEWAGSRQIELVEFPANWKTEGRHAALIRNERMLREGNPDLVVAFPGGRGTWHTCSKAEEAGSKLIAAMFKAARD